MSDVFVSYARSDEPRSIHIANALQKLGYKVWRDDQLPAHRPYAEVIEERLKSAKAVVVLWSGDAARSQWVRAEADVARNAGTLVQVTLDGSLPPLPFNQIQCADLSGRNGGSDGPGWAKLSASVAALVGGPQIPSEPVRPSPRNASLCVLPFSNMSGDPEQEYFSAGIAEDIATDLSKVSALEVIAYSGEPQTRADFREMSLKLGVSHVLEGSVRKAANRVRINAQLIECAGGEQVWAERYDRDLTDIFALQDELSEAIVGALKLRLLPQEKQAIGTRGTTNAKAYDFYIRARALRSMGGSGVGGQSIDAYRKAIEHDPGFASAWAGLASALAIRSAQNPEARLALREETRIAMARALELAPQTPDVVAAQSYSSLVEYDWETAERCIAFWSRSDSGWTVHPLLLHALGRVEHAVQEQRKVCALDPKSAGASYVFQHLLECGGRLDEADAEYERSRHLPAAGKDIEVRTIIRLMCAGEHSLAKSRFVEEFGDDASVLPYGPSLARAFDEHEEARRVLARALGDAGCQTPLRLNAIAMWAALFGDADLALTALRRASVEMRGLVLHLWTPAFSMLRSDPRFKKILVDIGLADHWRKSGNWGEFAQPAGLQDFELLEPGIMKECAGPQ